MSLVAGSAFSSSQSSSPVVPGMFTSRTITSGRATPRGSGTVSFGDVDVRHLERRPQQHPQRGIVIDQQDSHDARPPEFPYLDRFVGKGAVGLESHKRRRTRLRKPAEVRVFYVLLRVFVEP